MQAWPQGFKPDMDGLTYRKAAMFRLSPNQPPQTVIDASSGKPPQIRAGVAKQAGSISKEAMTRMVRVSFDHLLAILLYPIL